MMQLRAILQMSVTVKGIFDYKQHLIAIPKSKLNRSQKSDISAYVKTIYYWESKTAEWLTNAKRDTYDWLLGCYVLFMLDLKTGDPG